MLALVEGGKECVSLCNIAVPVTLFAVRTLRVLWALTVEVF